MHPRQRDPHAQYTFTIEGTVEPPTCMGPPGQAQGVPERAGAASRTVDGVHVPAVERNAVPLAEDPAAYPEVLRRRRPRRAVHRGRAGRSRPGPGGQDKARGGLHRGWDAGVSGCDTAARVEGDAQSTSPGGWWPSRRPPACRGPSLPMWWGSVKGRCTAGEKKARSLAEGRCSPCSGSFSSFPTDSRCSLATLPRMAALGRPGRMGGRGDAQTQANIYSSESRLPGGLPRAAGAAEGRRAGFRGIRSPSRWGPPPA